MNVPLPHLPTDIYGWLLLVAFIAAAYFVVRKGDISALREANDDLRKRLDDKDKENRDLQGQLNSFKQDLAKLTGIMEEKDKRIDALEHVEVKFPPEMITYMQDVRNFMTTTHAWMLTTTKTLTEMDQRSRMRQVSK